jgi:hypothetical protein
VLIWGRLAVDLRKLGRSPVFNIHLTNTGPSAVTRMFEMEKVHASTKMQRIESEAPESTRFNLRTFIMTGIGFLRMGCHAELRTSIPGEIVD